MKYYLVLCVFLIFIGLGVHGAIADTMPIDLSISFDNDILIADSQDQATINVSVFNRTTGLSEPNLPVTFTLNDFDLGSLSISETTTDSNGKASTEFTAKYATGTAMIYVMVNYHGTDLGPWEGTVYILGLPDEITIFGSVDVDWLVAGQTSTSSLITVEALNNSRPIPMLDVEFSVRDQFSVLDPSMGTLTVSNGKTDSDGKATTSFKPSTRSGVAYVKAEVKFQYETITYTDSRIHEQKIDHATPKEINWLDYPVEMLVGDNTTIQVHYVDQYNNSVDNQRYGEYLNFSVYSPSTDDPNPPEAVPAGFRNGDEDEYVEMITVELDENGFATVDMRADTRPGNNGITIDPQFTGDYRYINIEGIAEAVPVAIEYDISTHSPPDPYPNIPADGQSVFTILYTLRDQFNNPVENRYFWMNTTLGERTKLKTNSSGMVKVTYGPKTRTDIIDIIMTACDAKPNGTYASNSATVEITSTEPVQMSLTANPQFIPSWDVPGENTASIKAVVMDRYGNPVKNETVIMQVSPGTWDYEYDSGLGPQWRDYGDSTIVLTTTSPGFDTVDAYASAEFRPGFFPGLGDPPEQDSCIVTAQWAGYPTQSVTVNWTNVPFLSITTNVTPAVVSWNETLTVNIKLLGNGYALRPKPIDAVLIIDTSGSMDERMGGSGTPTRLRAAKDAAKNFVGNMDVSTGRDRIALVSFSSDAMVVQGLTDDKNVINSSIESLYAFGATNMRKAYYEGIKHLKENGRNNALKAVILMSDGDWNMHGNPLAEGMGFPDTDPYKSVYNRDYETSYGIPRSSYPWLGSGSSYNQATIKDSKNGYTYTINGYEWYSSLPDPKGSIASTQKYWERKYPYWDWKKGYVCIDGQDTNQNMSVFANSGDENRHVKIYSLGFAQDLNDNVEADLTILSEAADGWYAWAGDEEELDNLYTNIVGELKEEAGIGIQMDLPFEDIKVSTNTSSWTMDGKEVFDYVPYTDEWKYWFNTNPVTTIYHYPDRDDTTNWLSGEILFDIGTIKLNQGWETTFNLKVLNSSYSVGRITLFDQDATIMFSDGTDWHTLSLPTTYITCIGDQSETQVMTEEAGYDNIVTTIDDTVVTVSFDRVFLVDGIRYTNPWPYRWYEEYFISIPGYMGKTRIGKKTIAPDEQIPFGVPLQGTFTFDLKPFLPPGRDDVDFIFYVEGEDERGLGGRFRFNDSILDSRDGIFIFLR
jgi:hypothetical protein